MKIGKEGVMNDALRHEIVDHVVDEIRQKLLGKELEIDGYPILGKARISGLTEGTVRLLTALSK